MFSMFNQAFTSISVLFAALEAFAKTLLNLATIGNEMSASYADEQRILRLAKRAALNKEHGTSVEEPVLPT
jgi:hypothetical protein